MLTLNSVDSSRLLLHKSNVVKPYFKKLVFSFEQIESITGSLHLPVVEDNRVTCNRYGWVLGVTEAYPSVYVITHCSCLTFALWL